MDAAPSPPHPSQPSDSTSRHSTAHLEPSPSSPKSLPKDNRNDAAKDALAGACAGAVAKTVVAPIERVKLLMQLQFSIKKPVVKGNTEAVKSSGTNIGGSGVLDGGTNCTTKGGTKSASAWQVAMRVYQEQGILAFWRGNTPNVIRQGGSAAMNFLLMDKYKTAISPLLMWTMHLPSNRAPEKRQKRRALISSFLSGGLAGGTVTTALYPIEFVRTRLAMDVGRGTADAPRLYPGGMRDVCISIWRADGWRGFYQGYGIALAGVVVYRALHLGGYDAVKTEILHSRGHRVSLGDFRIVGEKNNDILSGSNNTLTMGERFLAAQIVSITAGTACYPIDSIRRRLMMQAGVPIEVRLYKNSLDCFRKVFASEGIRGFFLGIGPNLVRSFGAALLLVSYDVFKFII